MVTNTHNRIMSAAPAAASMVSSILSDLLLLSASCLTAALANAGLMLLNLSFHGDLDGYHIMNVLLGEAEDIVEVARDSVTLKDMRAELRRQGMTGKVKLGAYYLVIVLQYALPFSLILDIGGLFLWLR